MDSFLKHTAFLLDSSTHHKKEELIMAYYKNLKKQKYVVLLSHLSILLTFLSIGCDAYKNGDVLKTERASIIDGVPESGYDNVGFLKMRGEDHWSLCTGAAIAPNWVLTAAHCLAGYEPSDIVFYTGTDVKNDPGEAYNALFMAIHPAYEPEEKIYDIALIRVDGLVSGPFYDYNTSPVTIGTPVLWIGYGLYQSTPEQIGAGVKRQGKGIITQVSLRRIISDSDDGVLPCNGDSGGPEFAEIDGEKRLIGIASIGNCIDDVTHTRVDGFDRWIRLTMAQEAWTDCDVTGGECFGGACYPTMGGHFYCFPSEGLKPGDACDLNVDNWTAGIPCEDGAGCRRLEAGSDQGQCFTFCRNDTDCAGPEYCEIPTFSSIDNLGICKDEEDDSGFDDTEAATDTGAEPPDEFEDTATDSLEKQTDTSDFEEETEPPEEGTDTSDEESDPPEKETDTSDEVVDPPEKQTDVPDESIDSSDDAFDEDITSQDANTGEESGCQCTVLGSGSVGSPSVFRFILLFL
jgi:hypothetical protein